MAKVLTGVLIANGSLSGRANDDSMAALRPNGIRQESDLDGADGPASGIANRREGVPVERRGAVPSKRFQMIGRGIALVPRQPVLGIDRVPFFHPGVAMGFCQNGRCCDRYALGVTLDERLLLDQHVELHGVDQQIIRLHGELLERGSHGLAASLIDVPGVDTLGIDLGNSPGDGVVANAFRKLGASFGSKLFRIVQADDAAPGIENDGSRDDWAKERSAAGFIQARNARPTQLPRRTLETRRAEACHYLVRDQFRVTVGDSSTVLASFVAQRNRGFHRSDANVDAGRTEHASELSGLHFAQDALRLTGLLAPWQHTLAHLYATF
jgi:hypothetical protein